MCIKIHPAENGKYLHMNVYRNIIIWEKNRVKYTVEEEVVFFMKNFIAREEEK